MTKPEINIALGRTNTCKQCDGPCDHTHKFCSTECYFKYKVINKGEYATSSITKAKLSKIVKNKIANGEWLPMITNSWAGSRITIQHNGELVSYRSTWDAAFQILNPTLEYETIILPYISPIDNKWHNYIVDFVDRKNKILFEIKPISNIDTPIQNAKFNYAREWCKNNKYEFKIISDPYFAEFASKIEFCKYSPKLQLGMKQFIN